ncbi:hypothetical protein [Nocardia mangyaensis]|nr:hypothetical protein [Nocardia mangyaensis]
MRRDILGQLAQGLGNREIVRALHNSEATVKPTSAGLTTNWA